MLSRDPLEKPLSEGNPEGLLDTEAVEEEDWRVVSEALGEVVPEGGVEAEKVVEDEALGESEGLSVE